MTLTRKLTCLILALAAIASSNSLFSQTTPPHAPLGIERFDKAVNALVSPDAIPEKVVTCCKWVEGPVFTPQHVLLFSDIPHNRILQWDPRTKQLSTFLEPSGYTSSQAFAGVESGSNGMTLDSGGNLVVAGHASRSIFVVKLDGHRPIGPDSRRVLVDSYQGKRLNSPNDLIVRHDGSIYFTDPPYGLSTQNNSDPEKQLPFNGVFRFVPGKSARPGHLELLIQDLTFPNGIAFSPDQRFLYIAVSDPRHKVWMRYPVKPSGRVGVGRVFYDATSETAEGLPDGIKVDIRGNLYTAGPGGLWVFSPSGRHLATIHTGERVSNCGWGDDGHSLYITSSTSVYRVRTLVSGRMP